MQPRTDNAPGTVFIVDDEAMVTTSIQTLLELDTPHRIHTFNSPLSALDALGETRPDVVVSDFLMPEMDGIAFLKEVKNRLPETTLILLTGYADKENAIAAINAVGIYKYIEKPWDNEQLKLSIENGLERSRLLRNLRETVAELTEARDALARHSQHLEELVAERTADLQLTYQKLESIVEGTADGIITLDHDGVITSLNPAARQWIEAQLGLEAPRTIDEVLTLPEGRPLDTSLDFQAPAQMKEALIGALPVEISLSTLSGDHSGYVLVLRDISRRKEIERLRDDFVSTLTHDLRTPLLAAIQTLSFFEDESLGELNEKQHEIARMLIQSNRDMLGLVNVLLEVYKYESGRQKLIMENVRLDELIRAIGLELEALARQKEQSLSVHLPGSMPAVRGDKQELRRVLVNLIGNAIHHTPAGGEIQVAGSVNGGSVTVTVADNGRGIPEKDIPKLFQRFSQGTSKVRSSGTGLGLYLSRQIIDAHQGSIWVESEEGKGSAFSFELPV